VDHSWIDQAATTIVWYMGQSAETISRLRGLKAQPTNTIERLQDFHVLTGFGYDRFSKMVAAGRLVGSVQNGRTATNLPTTGSRRSS
jgi:hypothetical protein